MLLLFHRNVYPERGARVEHDIRARVDAALLHGETPDAPTARLVHLAAACRIADATYPRNRHAAIKARIAELDDAGAAGANAAAELVARAETAAVAAATVAATGAATTAACSTSTVACT